MYNKLLIILSKFILGFSLFYAVSFVSARSFLLVNFSFAPKFRA